MSTDEQKKNQSKLKYKGDLHNAGRLHPCKPIFNEDYFFTLYFAVRSSLMIPFQLRPNPKSYLFFSESS